MVCLRAKLAVHWGQFVEKFRVILAGVLTLFVSTVVCVLLFFKPLSDGDSPGAPWPDWIALPIYLIFSVILHDWLSVRIRNSYTAALALGAAQAVLIVDLLARGERGVVTAIAGIAMLIITWGTLAFVHNLMTRSQA